MHISSQLLSPGPHIGSLRLALVFTPWKVTYAKISTFLCESWLLSIYQHLTVLVSSALVWHLTFVVLNLSYISFHIQAGLRDIVGSVRDHRNKVSIAIKWAIVFLLVEVLPSVCKNRTSVRCDKAKHDQMKYACIKVSLSPDGLTSSWGQELGLKTLNCLNDGYDGDPWSSIYTNELMTLNYMETFSTKT